MNTLPLRHAYACRILSIILLFNWSGLSAYIGNAQNATEPRGGAPSPANLQQAAEPQASPNAESARQSAQRLERVFSQIERVARDVPRESFDPGAIVNRVGKDPNSLFEWVRDNTFWVGYQGALRGPKGVLMDRIGNSLDRSLLLCALLQAAGHKARLAQGSLDAEQSRQLLSKVRVREERQPTEAVQRGEVGDAAIRQFAEGAGISPSPLRAAYGRDARIALWCAQQMIHRVAEQTPELKRIAGISDAQATDATTPLSAMQEHWWAQWQDGEKWVDLDPLLPAGKAGESVTRPTATLAPNPKYGTFKLDKRLWHEVEVRVVIETWKDGRLREAAVLEHTWRTAESPGAHFRLTHVPTNWPTDFGSGGQPLFDQYEELLSRDTTWLPVLITDAEPLAQKSFNDAGELNDTPSAPVLQGGGGMVGRGVGGILGSHRIGGPKEPSQLTAEWIEYVIREPGKDPRVIRREIFDLIGPAARAAKPDHFEVTPPQVRTNRALALLGETEILITGCGLSPRFVENEFIQTLLANRPVLLDIVKHPELASAEDRAPLLQRLSSLRPPPERLWSFALLRRRWSPQQANIYLESPNVFAYHRRLERKSAGKYAYRFGYDLVENHVGVRRDTELPPFAVRLEQGIVDTNCEAILMARGGRVENTSELFQTSLHSQKIRWTAVTNLSELKDNSAATADIRRRLQQELASGPIVVAPSQAVKLGGRVVMAWWRIDPRTGDTLGIGQNGYGQSTSENSLMTTKRVMSVVGACLTIVLFARCISENPAPSAPPGLPKYEHGTEMAEYRKEHGFTPEEERSAKHSQSCVLGLMVHLLADMGCMGLASEVGTGAGGIAAKTAAAEGVGPEAAEHIGEKVAEKVAAGVEIVTSPVPLVLGHAAEQATGPQEQEPANGRDEAQATGSNAGESGKSDDQPASAGAGTDQGTAGSASSSSASGPADPNQTSSSTGHHYSQESEHWGEPEKITDYHEAELDGD